jgi:hypothetical protein
MRLFRNQYISSGLTLITGLVFLNLSFFLTELSLFNCKNENSALYSSLAQAFSTICEEEKDPLNNESSDTENEGKELDIILITMETAGTGFYFVLTKNNPSQSHHPCDGTSFKVHQPPELHS